MPTYLFPDATTNRETHDAAIEYWSQLWSEVISQAGGVGNWIAPWQNNPMYDGNPIFTAIEPKLKHAVRIVHEDPRDFDDNDLDWWLDMFGEDVRELVIACCPTRENHSSVVDLLAEWVRFGRINGAATVPASPNLPSAATPSSPGVKS